MPIYEVQVRHLWNERPKTSADYKPKTAEKTKAVKSDEKDKILMSPHRVAMLGVATTVKINNWVGEYTENTIAAKRANVGLTFAGIGLLALSHPIGAAISAAGYGINAAVEYGIRIDKANKTAGFLRELSGGTTKIR